MQLPKTRFGSAFPDRIVMLLPNQANGVPLSIDNRGKQVENVTAQHAHIESFQVGATGKLAVEYRLAAIIMREAYLRLHHYRSNQSSRTAKPIRAVNRLKTKRRQYIRAENCAVGDRIDKEGGFYPGTISGQDFAAEDGPDHPIIAQVPQTVDAHRCGTSFPEECIE
jgi:hypothetical protein